MASGRGNLGKSIASVAGLLKTRFKGSYFICEKTLRVDDFLLPYKAQLLKDAVGEVMKLLKDRIPSETLASVASSLNGHTLGDVNNNELCQGDGEGNDVVDNDEYDVERNVQSTEREDEDFEDS
ncbi:hypothetical protein PHJA_001072100 [Phtheirospermum japonicum]|uniref:Uncharacterized protein n=1 Tax=Phtheirospermum japonicum TaxID=374723 RepID=A0A830BYD3_9LAMI|nr:hypothetical protein PHJA_001072100 [Phtheirospermum japonicum]